MNFTKFGEYFGASRITGPKHNLLQIGISERSGAEVECEQIPAMGTCRHAPMDRDLIVASVLDGIAEANRKFGSSYAVTKMRYVENDTGPESVYSFLAYKIIERLQQGESFEIVPDSGV